MRLRRAEYVIRERPDGYWGNDPKRCQRIPVVGWTAPEIEPFAIRKGDRPGDIRPTWKVDHMPTGFYAVSVGTKAEALIEAQRFAGATVDGQPVDWRLSRRALSRLKPRMAFPTIKDAQS